MSTNGSIHPDYGRQFQAMTEFRSGYISTRLAVQPSPLYKRNGGKKKDGSLLFLYPALWLTWMALLLYSGKARDNYLLPFTSPGVEFLNDISENIITTIILWFVPGQQGTVCCHILHYQRAHRSTWWSEYHHVTLVNITILQSQHKVLNRKYSLIGIICLNSAKQVIIE